MESESPEKKYDEVDFETAIDDYGDETVQFCVKAFLDKTYNELKTNLPTLYKAQNYKDIRGKMHILKTNSGYMGAMNFQALCKEFEACCKFESLNVQRIDELYPIFMINLDKLYKRLKVLYAEKFETEIKEEVELENKKEEDDKIIENKKEEDKDKKEEKKLDEIKNNNNIIIIEEKPDIEKKENKIEEKKDNIKEDNNLINNIEEKKEKKGKNMNSAKTFEKLEEDILDENEKYNLIINKNPIKKDFSLQQPKINSIKFNILNKTNQNLSSINNEKEKSLVSSEHSLNLNDIIKPRNFSSKNVLDLISLKEGKSHRYHQDQFYKNIFQSLRLTEEESKNKKIPKKQFSPKYSPESQKNKILNRLKLGFSSLDKNDIRDSLKRYDLSVLKNSATLVKENLIKFLDEEIPKIKVELNTFLENHDLSKKKEVIEKVNIIISNMKYLSDNYNTFFFRVIERIEICKDRKSFKSILKKLIDKLYLLEQELTIIYRVKIKRDDSILKSLGYFQNDNLNKNSKKKLTDEMYNNYNVHRNKENNPEQIEGLKKNLGMYNNNKNKNSKKSFIHLYSFKVQRLFYLEDKKNIHTSFKTHVLNKNENKISFLQNKENEENKEIIIINNDDNDIENNKNIENKYNNFKDNKDFSFDVDSHKCLDIFKNSINNKNKEELIQAISDFQENLVKKYYFTNMDQNIEKWISKIKKSDNFDDLNAYIEDIEEIIDYMKNELENKNVENHNDEESENEEIYNINEKKDKEEEDVYNKEDMALFNQFKKFNPDGFFLPRNPAFTQHKFKMKVEKIIREITQNPQEIIQNNYNSNYNLVEKTSSHIILSQNFRTKKNKLIGFSYPFKEDTFLNNCNII